MAETKGSLHLNLDPISLILSQYSPSMNSDNTLQFTTDSYFMERGPRYNKYSQLRESKLQSKRVRFNEDEVQEPEIPRSEITPVKKSVRFQSNIPSSGRKQGSSVLAQSVPDFSALLRKENRKPSENIANRIPRPVDKSVTPPPSMSKREKMYGSGMKGSKSVNSGEKQSGGGGRVMMARKSYASIEELKGLSIAASNAINGENRGGSRRGNVLRKSTVLSTRYY